MKNRCFSCSGIGHIDLKAFGNDLKFTCQLCFGTGEAQTCDVCLDNLADGSVGSMLDLDVFIMCCKNCYHHALGLKPLAK